MNILPTIIEIAAGERAATLTLTNVAAEPIVFQSRTVAWAQEGGANRYAESRDLVVSPPIFTIPAKSSQVVRIGFRGERDAAREMSYRLILKEVPPADRERFRLVLELNLPVFAAPAVPRRPPPTYQVSRSPDGVVVAKFANAGNVRLEINRIELLDASGGVVFFDRGGGVLAGSERIWRFDAEGVRSHRGALALKAETDRGVLEADVVAESR